MTAPNRIGGFVVRRVLGEGSLGRVYLAQDESLAREVAVKVLAPSLELSEEQRRSMDERVRQEARAAASVEHPHVATLFQLGFDPSFGVFLVFELIRGATLRTQLREGGPLALVDVARLAEQVGDALASAHESGVLHRDIKPENLMLGRFGWKVTDFGIARLMDGGHESGAFRPLLVATDAGGPPAYTAPEARSLSMYTARNDQYALATTLVEALTGQLPDVDGDGQLRTLAAPQLPPAVAERLTEVLRRGRHPRAEARYPTCRDLGQAVAAAIETPRALPVRFSLSDSQRDTTEESAPLRPSLPPESGGASAREVAQTRRTQNIIVGLALLVLIGLFLWRRKERVRVESLTTPSATATQTAP